MTTAPNQPMLRRADPADADTITTFLDGPIADWLIPDRDTRREVYRQCFALVTGHALTHGDVRITSDDAAVALWYPRIQPVPDDPQFEARLAQGAGEHIGRFGLKLAATAAHHPTAAHHHLAYLGVKPTRQGMGLGSRLLRAYHEELDRAGIPAFLEATNDRNYRLTCGTATPRPGRCICPTTARLRPRPGCGVTLVRSTQMPFSAASVAIRFWSASMVRLLSVMVTVKCLATL